MSSGIGIFDPDVTIVPVAPSAVGPQPPTLFSIYQAGGETYASATLGLTTGSLVPISINLYRSLDAGATWELAGSSLVDSIAVRTLIVDPSPSFGPLMTYGATVVDSAGAESNKSNFALFIAATTLPSMAPGTGISQAALGPLPFLGSDILLDPQTRMTILGANGDLETVNGLDCVAQDLRIKFLTETGQLALDPTTGLEPFIGIGQGSPTTQAQIIRSDALFVLQQEPRLAAILGITVGQLSEMGWGIAYSAVTRNGEDPGKLSQVAPYYFS